MHDAIFIDAAGILNKTKTFLVQNLFFYFFTTEIMKHFKKITSMDGM